MPTPEELAFLELLGESPPIPQQPPVQPSGPRPTAAPRPVSRPEEAIPAFDPSIQQSSPIPPAPPQAPAPQQAPQQAAPQTIPPEIAAQIEAMPGFAASRLSVEQLAPLLSQDPFTGAVTFDATAFSKISSFIRQTAADVRKGEEREAKETQDEADRTAAEEREAAKIEPQDVPKNIDQLMTKALLEGNFDFARRLNDFKKQPTSFEKLRLAMDFATSPGDSFIVSAIARGVFPDQPPLGLGETRPIPAPGFSQDLFNEAFGVNQDPFAGFQFPRKEEEAPPAGAPPQETEIPSQPLVREPASQTPQPGSQFQDLFQNVFEREEEEAQEEAAFARIPPPSPTGFAGAQAAFQDLEDEELRDEQALARIQQPGLKGPVEGTSAFGGSAAANPFAQGSQFPANEPFKRVGQIPEPIGLPALPPAPPPPAAFGQPTPPTNAGQSRPLPSDRIVPEGASPFTISIGGKQIEVPNFFGDLFRGIKDPSVQLQRPKSLLGAVGLPRLDPGTFSRLTAQEQDDFIGLTRLNRIDPRDLRREMESARPVQPSRTRISSAAGRSR